jgi:hypothetical protein
MLLENSSIANSYGTNSPDTLQLCRTIGLFRQNYNLRDFDLRCNWHILPGKKIRIKHRLQFGWNPGPAFSDPKPPIPATRLLLDALVLCSSAYIRFTHPSPPVNSGPRLPVLVPSFPAPPNRVLERLKVG